MQSTSPWCTCTAQWVIPNPSLNNGNVRALVAFLDQPDDINFDPSNHPNDDPIHDETLVHIPTSLP
ncbi:16598_t:CDS:2 [Funneliformis mosseae]|uniref:16598_t:CDS:1 n=1 Tax=Funneliformis mosseae TaxID=27381 RepID=A0A9N9BT41_FUNMO|nr:16598_t:CDS:2 [Funneliformis mosseae]